MTPPEQPETTDDSDRPPVTRESLGQRIRIPLASGDALYLTQREAGSHVELALGMEEPVHQKAVVVPLQDLPTAVRELAELTRDGPASVHVLDRGHLLACVAVLRRLQADDELPEEAAEAVQELAELTFPDQSLSQLVEEAEDAAD